MNRKVTMFLLSLTFLLSGCAAAPPIKNRQLTESNLPTQCRIEGIEPIKKQVADSFGSHWVTCIDMILNFYGRPLGKDTKDKAKNRVLARNISVAATSAVIGGLTVPYIPSSDKPEGYYHEALGLHGFKRYTFYDQSPNGTKIKYLLAQGHPVIAWLGLLTGYDDQKEVFFVCDTSLGEAIERPYKDFPRRQAMEWADTSKLIRRGEIIYPVK